VIEPASAAPKGLQAAPSLLCRPSQRLRHPVIRPRQRKKPQLPAERILQRFHATARRLEHALSPAPTRCSLVPIED
jgi:hypothetical protein